MSTSTPYWGQLPSPKARRSSSDGSDRRYSLDQPRAPQSKLDSQRISTQTANTDALTESTFSPIASPTASNAPGGGLAPRPPSFPYAQHQYSDSTERRRRRSNKSQGDDLYDFSDTASPPPAAPDVPRAPPLSYKAPFGSPEPYTYRPHSTYRPDPQPRTLIMEPETFYKDATPPAEQQSSRPVLDCNFQTFDDGVVPTEHLERELLRTGSLRRPTNGHRQPERFAPEPTSSSQRRESPAPDPQRNMWAADRSPLQKLELTLDSITKEEKRARVEAAERRARERAARNSASAGTAEFEKSAANSTAQKADNPDRRQSVHVRKNPQVIVADPIPAQPSTAATRGSSSRSPYEDDNPIRPHGQSPRSQIPVAKKRNVSGTEHNRLPQRGLSFKERASSQDPELPQEFADGPAREAPGRRPTVALGRSGSNKLKKNPPGDPWYNARTEAEERSTAYDRLNSFDDSRYGETVPTSHRTAHDTTDHVKNEPISTEDLPRPPARGKAFADEAYEAERPSRMRGLAAAIGLGRSNSMSNRQQPPPSHYQYESPSHNQEYSQGDENDASPTQKQGRATMAGFGKANSIDMYPQSRAPVSALHGAELSERGTKSVKFQDGDPGSEMFGSNVADSGRHEHHLGHFFHRDHLRPGRGMYKPPVYSDEWKKGAIGLLSESQMDLREEPQHDQAPDKNTPWWESDGKRRSSFTAQPHRAQAYDGAHDENQRRTRFTPPLYLKCGPLLRYCGMRHETPMARTARGDAGSNKEIWRGSVMIVTQDSESSYDLTPTLRLFVQPMELMPPPPAELRGEEPLSPEYVDPIAGIPKLGRQGETLYVRPVEHLEEGRDLSIYEPDDGLFELIRSAPDFNSNTAEPPGSFTSRKKRTEVDGEKLGKLKDVRGVRLHEERGHTFWRFNIEVELRDKQQRIAYRINRGPATGFWVPARGEVMNVMFHSCNGFSHSVDPDEFSGPDPMWRDVLNTHQTRPFHVMIGGGDQVYNDAVMDGTKLFHDWLQLRNPLHKSNAPFTPEMQDELENFYLQRYMMWFSQGLFGLANSQIPMVNMYDDHDIIDGFGSYPDHFMKAPVFSGLGNVAFKYYMLFQHQSLPSETEEFEPSWILGEKPGPYINELSRSVFVSLGERMALLAVDARTERTREQVVTEETWKKLIDRCYNEIVKGKTQHLLVLLGVPIAYPRLVWLENILTSRLLDPIKALGKAGLLGNFLNNFDGGVEVLDDLDDHWTAKNHKEERRFVIEDLQDLAADKSVRVTILSGDVHLAAAGQFYSNPKLKILKHNDFRYMPNIISSAIANTPPPDLLADVLNKRNKVHHFDKETDESMIPLFTHGVDGKARNNKHLLPHRNWCSIREYVPGHTPPPTPPPEEFDHTPEGSPPASRGGILRRLSLSKSKGPALRPDVPKDADRSRPPISGGGFMRSFSRRGSVSGSSERPRSSGLFRSLSLGSRRKKNRSDDDGMNRSWLPDHGDDFVQTPPHRIPHGAGDIGLRGGVGGSEYEIGDEAHFTARPPQRALSQPVQDSTHYAPDSEEGEEWPRAAPRPFHRTPTGLSVKKLRKNGAERYEVNVENGLEVCINVEVNPKDPAGITVPYRLLVPKLWYEYTGEDGVGSDVGMEQHGEQGQAFEEEDAGIERPKQVSGLRRWFSGRGKGAAAKGQMDGGDDWERWEESEVSRV
ncbi:hypothetical protein GGR57DRAFT_36959 [Xylariaceae sp. FL1272]|nr:hypothetical protein GGR57DRAFT_36959 [Xylariaceae sp. FL1272]